MSYMFDVIVGPTCAVEFKYEHNMDAHWVMGLGITLHSSFNLGHAPAYMRFHLTYPEYAHPGIVSDNKLNNMSFADT